MSDRPLFIVRERADQDLEELFVYGRERFGLARAVRYIRDLEVAFYFLADNPLKGKPFDAALPGCRCFGVESHFIFYRQHVEKIEILRILHRRMSPLLHLE